MIKYSNRKIIDCNDFDDLVQETYNKIYSFQQQDGCKPRGYFTFEVPCEYNYDDEMNETIPEIINDEHNRGVKFETWLKRNADAPLNPSKEEIEKCHYYLGKNDKDLKDWKNDKMHILLFWERNFYPDIYTLINDLYDKGLIEKGDYAINIDW